MSFWCGVPGRRLCTSAFCVPLCWEQVGSTRESVESELTHGHQVAPEIPTTGAAWSALGAGDWKGERRVFLERPELALQEFMIIACIGFGSQLLFHQPLQNALGTLCTYMYTCVGCMCASTRKHTSAHILMCLCVHKGTYEFMSIHSHMYTRIHTWTQMGTRAHTSISTHK